VRLSNRFKSFLAAVAVLLMMPAQAGAQTVRDERLWFTNVVQDNGGSPWHWSMEMLVRSRNGVDNLDSFGLRAFVTRDLTSRSTVGGGYGVSRQYPALGRHLTEHRFIGQYALRLSLAGGVLSFRTRVEDRWILYDTGHIWRFREQVRYTHPFREGSRWSAVGYGEIFVHFNSTNRYVKGVEQMRTFGGVGFRVSASARVEAGYLNQFIRGPGIAPDRMNHVLSTSLQLAF
jgi:hypothetical protein